MLRHLKYHIIDKYRYKRGVADVCQPSILYNIWIKIEGSIYTKTDIILMVADEFRVSWRRIRQD